MKMPIMQRVAGDGIEIQMAIWEGSGPPVLCIHGLTANCRCWDQMASTLAPAFTLMAMDLRGRGLSGKPERGYSLDHHLRDLDGILDSLKQDRTVLMGHSLGAFIALAFAARRPERVAKLVLIDGGGSLSQAQWDRVGAAIKPSLERLGQVFPSFEAYTRHLKGTSYLQPWSEAIETYFRYEVELVAGGVRSKINPAHIAEEAQNLRRENPSGYHAQVRCPVLILRATRGILSAEDLVLPEAAVAAMLAALPQAECVSVAPSNHFSLLIQPQPERDRAVKAFLERESAAAKKWS
jgi:pimeloyl-ACP methyl ester carboxylesterase